MKRSTKRRTRKRASYHDEVRARVWGSDGPPPAVRRRRLQGGNWHIVQNRKGDLLPARLPGTPVRLSSPPLVMNGFVRPATIELERAIAQRDPDAIREAAADLANVALIVAETAGNA